MNIPTAIPLVYEFDDDMHVIDKHYLGDQKVLAAKMQVVKNQGKPSKKDHILVLLNMKNFDKREGVLIISKMQNIAVFKAPIEGKINRSG